METLYEKLGKEGLHQLVERFYDEVFASGTISQLFLTDKETIKAKQEAFLTQFLGGPQLYSSTYGHPKMRMRHLPHAIGQEEKEEWLRCMKTAIQGLDIDEQLKQAIYNCFPPLAQHMVNR